MPTLSRAELLNPKQILLGDLDEYPDAEKWIGDQFEKIKRISNTKVGDVRSDFVEQLCRHIGFECAFPAEKGELTRMSPWDIRIEDVVFELKTAIENVHGNFQINHIRCHRAYEELLCMGIGPDIICLVSRLAH